MTHRLIVALIISACVSAHAETGAAYRAEYLLDKRMLELDAENAERTAQIKASENKALETQMRYQKMVDAYDPNYKADEPMCDQFRADRIALRRQKRITQLTREYDLHDKIVGRCHETKDDVYVKYSGHFIDGAKSLLPFFNTSDLHVSERLHHKGLSADASDILNYEKLDEVLNKECYPGEPQKVARFRLSVIVGDLLPTVVGSAAALSLYALAGKACKQALAPVKLPQKTVTVVKWSYKIVLGIAIAIPTITHFILKRDEYLQKNSEIEQANQVDSLAVEMMFPEVSLDVVKQDCWNAKADAANLIKDGITDEGTLASWNKITELKCQMYINHAVTALNFLKSQEETRCQPANKGAEERISSTLNELIKQNPQLKDYADKKLSAQP